MTTSFFHAESLAMIFRVGEKSLTIFDNLSMDLKQGEMVALVGDSGTGKTTLLHLFGALARPSKGKIFFKGKDYDNYSDQDLAHFRNREIGFVFQFHHLLAEFSALENVIMPGLISSQNDTKLKKEGKLLLERVGLKDRIEHPVSLLSGGEQQRVALARALILKPKMLLADEPTGNLDPETSLKVFELIKSLNDEFNLSTIMVTHNHKLAQQMNRSLRISHGQLEPMIFS